MVNKDSNKEISDLFEKHSKANSELQTSTTCEFGNYTFIKEKQPFMMQMQGKDYKTNRMRKTLVLLPV